MISLLGSIVFKTILRLDGDSYNLSTIPVFKIAPFEYNVVVINQNC